MENRVIGISGTDEYGDKDFLYVEISPDGEMTDVTNRRDIRPGVRAQSGADLKLHPEGYLYSHSVGWEDPFGNAVPRHFYLDPESAERLREETRT